MTALLLALVALLGQDRFRVLNPPISADTTEVRDFASEGPNSDARLTAEAKLRVQAAIIRALQARVQLLTAAAAEEKARAEAAAIVQELAKLAKKEGCELELEDGSWKCPGK